MESWSESDRSFMRRALQEAAQAAAAGEVPVGAVVVCNSRLIGHGYNQPIGRCDPTAHAEMLALRMAAQAVHNYRIGDATVYVTLEPCAMCVGAMLHARIARLVFGAYDSKTGAAGTVIDLTGERRLGHRLEVNGGLLEDECAGVLQQFFTARRR